MGANADALFEARIDDQTGKFFVRLDKNLTAAERNKAFDILEKKVNKFGGAAGQAGLSKTKGLLAISAGAGIALVAVNALLKGLTTAATKFGEIISDSVSLASGLETARITFTNILGDNPEAAESFLKRLNQQALDLGVNFSSLTGFSKSLLPDTASIDEFDRLVEAAVTLDRSDPDKTIDDVRFAFEEALSGNLRSLIQRFDLPRQVATSFSEGLAEGQSKVEALTNALQEEFERTGQNLESFTDTFATTFSRIGSQVDSLKTTLGEPILTALTEQLSRLDKFLKDNQENLTLFAAALGDVVAEVVDFIGTGLNDFLEDFDTEKLLEFVDRLGDGVKIGLEFGKTVFEIARTLGDLFSSLSPLVVIFRSAGEEIGDATEKAGGFGEALLGILDFTNKLKAGFEGFAPLFRPIIELVGGLADAFVKLLKGDFAGAANAARGAVSNLEGGLFDLDAATAAVNTSYDESTVRLEELRSELDDNNKAMDERRDKLNENAKAGNELVDNILKEKNALKDLEAQTKKAADADADLIKVKTKLAQQAIKRQIEETRRLTDVEIAESRRREDLARETAKTLDRISGGAASERAQVLANAGEEANNVEQDASKRRRQIEQDRRDNILDIEKNFRRQLRDIQEQFEKSATEAQISNDVQAFLQAKRQRNDSITDAKDSREQQTSDANSQAKKETSDLKAELKERRAELDESLQQQLAAVEANAERERQVFFDSLAEREEERKLAVQRQEEDRQLELQRQEEDLLRSLEEQVNALKDKHGEFADVTAQGLATQSQEYVETYGTGGNVDNIMRDFFNRQQKRLSELSAARQSLQRGSSRSGTSSRPAPSGGIGQAGLVSEFLSNSANRQSPATISGGTSTQNVNNTSNNNLSFDFTGLTPFVQRIAAQAATEVFRNTVTR